MLEVLYVHLHVTVPTSWAYIALGIQPEPLAHLMKYCQIQGFLPESMEVCTESLNLNLIQNETSLCNLFYPHQSLFSD